MKTLWVSNSFATFTIDIDDHMVIIKTAPIARKWKGAILGDFLRYWRIDKMEEI